MEDANPLVIQVFANLGGFGLLFWLIKRMIDRRDTAFDKMVELLNGMLVRQAETEKTQGFHEHRIENLEDEVKGMRIVHYPQNPKKR